MRRNAALTLLIFLQNQRILRIFLAFFCIFLHFFAF